MSGQSVGLRFFIGRSSSELYIAQTCVQIMSSFSQVPTAWYLKRCILIWLELTWVNSSTEESLRKSIIYVNFHPTWYGVSHWCFWFRTCSVVHWENYPLPPSIMSILGLCIPNSKIDFPLLGQKNNIPKKVAEMCWCSCSLYACTSVMCMCMFLRKDRSSLLCYHDTNSITLNECHHEPQQHFSGCVPL